VLRKWLVAGWRGLLVGPERRGVSGGVKITSPAEDDEMREAVERVVEDGVRMGERGPPPEVE
jgi:hypothetical protein